MSGNENENVSQGNGEGNGAADWGWEPVPHGGEFDSDATAFVKLPQDMLDALDTGEPLAAPGHGYVPPPMIVPLGSASTDPASTGTWAIPVQWPEAGGGAGGGAPAGGSSPGGASSAPVGGPIPASVPLPASVAAAFGGPPADQQQQSDGVEHDPGATAQWRFADPAPGPDAASTGQWAVPERLDGPGEFRQGGLDADWSQAPATLPGGAPAPWATHPDYAAARGYAAGSPDADRLPGTDEAVAAAVAAAATATAATAGRLLGGPGVGSAQRGPRILGGPGVGTPLPETEPAAAAPHDIEAAHGPADTDGHGFAAFGHGPGHGAGREPHRGSAPEREAGPAYAAEPEREAEQDPEAGPEPGYAGSVEPAGVEPVDADGHGFTGAGPAAAGTGIAPAPTGDTADTAVVVPGGDTAEDVPAEVPSYEESAPEPVTGLPGADHEHPAASYVLRVNGADRPVTGAWIGESLLYVLRERLGLAGAKDGCSQGECGACAVQVDGRLVASCLVPAATAAGSEVRTVEGLATDGELSDVQQALCRSGAVQCGFCVPGMAMTIHDLLEGNHAPSELETRQALCGNLCRCSGYAGVVEAVREVVAARREAAADSGPAAPPEPRIPHQAAPGEGGIHHGHGGTA